MLLTRRQREKRNTGLCLISLKDNPNLFKEVLVLFLQSWLDDYVWLFMQLDKLAKIMNPALDRRIEKDRPFLAGD